MKDVGRKVRNQVRRVYNQVGIRRAKLPMASWVWSQIWDQVEKQTYNQVDHQVQQPRNQVRLSSGQDPARSVD